MRTPGHDFELAAGFCFTDGLLAGAPVQTCRYCGTGSAVETEFNVVSVETGGAAPVPTPRLTTTTSSCGLCGSTVDRRAGRAARTAAARRRRSRSTCWRRCPTVRASRPGAVRHHRCRARRGGLRPRRRGRCSCARTSGGTTPSTRWSAACCSTTRCPRTDLGLYVSGRASLRDRAEGVGGRVRRRGGGRAPRRRSPSTPPAGELLARRVRAGRARSTCTPRTADGLTRSERAASSSGVGRACGPTGSGSRSPTTTARWSRWPGTTARHPKYAWDVLTKGVCDGCALGRGRPARLDDRRRAPVHHPAAAARGQHRRRVRPDRARPTSTPLTDRTGERAARPRPARPSDASAPRRAGLPPDLAGTRRSTRSASAIGRSGGERAALYLTSRGITNETLLRGRQGGPGHGHGQRRLRRPGVPRALHARPEGRPSAWPRRRARCRT